MQVGQTRLRRTQRLIVLQDLYAMDRKLQHLYDERE